MADFGVTVLVGFVDYIRKLAETARDAGLIERLGIRMICGHLGTEDRAATEAAWGGAKAFDWYGVGDTGSIAGEGPERDGMYVWEDAQYLELLDVDDGTPGALWALRRPEAAGGDLADDLALGGGNLRTLASGSPAFRQQADADAADALGKFALDAGGTGEAPLLAAALLDRPGQRGLNQTTTASAIQSLPGE
eukprot:gene42994-58213_t